MVTESKPQWYLKNCNKNKNRLSVGALRRLEGTIPKKQYQLYAYVLYHLRKQLARADLLLAVIFILIFQYIQLGR